MPASLKDLRTRIRSVKNTQQITKAMKLVSAAKFAKAQIAVTQARPYIVELQKLARELAPFTSVSHPLMASNEQGAQQRTLVLVFGSERGLCGGYNNNIAKLALNVCKDLKDSGASSHIICFGKKVLPNLLKGFRSLGLNPRVRHVNWDNLKGGETLSNFESPEEVTCIGQFLDRPSQEKANSLARILQELFLSKNCNSIQIVYNFFQSALTQMPKSETLLPVQIHTEVEGSSNVSKSLMSPSANLLLEDVIPKVVQTHFYQMILETAASEHGARMTAMESATRNAKEMEKKLQLTYQRARQAAITKELVEIISGAEAL